MEYLFEFLLDLVLEGSIEASKNEKIPKYIRYPIIVFISFFFLLIIGLILWVGFSLLKENLACGLFFLFLGLFMLGMGIIKFRKLYLVKKSKKTIFL